MTDSPPNEVKKEAWRGLAWSGLYRKFPEGFVRLTETEVDALLKSDRERIRSGVEGMKRVTGGPFDDVDREVNRVLDDVLKLISDKE